MQGAKSGLNERLTALEFPRGRVGAANGFRGASPVALRGSQKQ